MQHSHMTRTFDVLINVQQVNNHIDTILLTWYLTLFSDSAILISVRYFELRKRDKMKTEKITFEISETLSTMLQKLRDAARASNRDTVSDRYTTVNSSIAFLLDFAITEQQRRFDKAKTDSLARKLMSVRDSHAQMIADAISRNDFESAKKLASEYAALAKK